jgi:hypothetical protein
MGEAASVVSAYQPVRDAFWPSSVSLEPRNRAPCSTGGTSGPWSALTRR